MSEEYTHVRLRRRTHQALMEMIASRANAADRAQMLAWWDGDTGPSADAMISWMIRHVRRDRERAARARARAAERRRADLGQLVFEPTPGDGA